MKISALETLEEIEKQNRGKRLKDLLKNPESDHDDNWYMAVPPCFNDALDIKWNCGAPSSGV